MIQRLLERLGAWLSRDAIERMHQQQEPPAAEPAAPWRTLPGGVIELGDTGFLIRHRPGAETAEFLLESPEGRTMFTAGPGFLAPLKQAAERCAAERDEFRVRVATDGLGDAVATLLARAKGQP